MATENKPSTYNSDKNRTLNYGKKDSSSMAKQSETPFSKTSQQGSYLKDGQDKSNSQEMSPSKELSSDSQSWISDVTSTSKELDHKVRSFIKAKPLAIVLGTVAVGLAGSFLVRRILSARSESARGEA